MHRGVLRVLVRKNDAYSEQFRTCNQLQHGPKSISKFLPRGSIVANTGTSVIRIDHQVVNTMTTIMRRDDPGLPGVVQVGIQSKFSEIKQQKKSRWFNAKTRMDEQTEPANQKARNSL